MKSIRFKTIEIENFGSIKETKFGLDPRCYVQLQGKNGTGKTTLISALCWVLYGENLKGVSNVNSWDYIDTEGIGTMVSLEFDKDNIPCKIIRCQKYSKKIPGENVKGSSNIFLYIDGKLYESKYKKDIQKEINSIMGISYKLFLNSIVFGQGMKRFIQETGSDKKEIVTEILNLEYITLAKELTKENIAKLKEEEHTLISKIDKEEYGLKMIENQLDLLGKLEEVEDNQTKKVKAQIKDLRKEIEGVEGNIQSKKNELEAYNIKDISENLSKIVSISNNLKETIKDSKKKLNSLTLEGLLDTVIEKIENKDPKVLQYLKKVKEPFIVCSKAEKDLAKYHTKYVEYQQKKLSYQSLCESIDFLKRSKRNKEDQISKLKESKEYNKSNISEEERQNLELNIKKSNITISNLKTSLEEVQNLLKDYQWVYSTALGNSGIKSFLFESSLVLINKYLRAYSPLIGFDVSFVIDLSTTKKDFLIQISHQGQEVSYEELSGGQKQLVNLVVAFAMNRMVIEQGDTDFNVAFLDEVFESLSQDNIEIVISLIKEIYKDKSLFIISHHQSLPITNSRIVTVNKDPNGPTYYI